MRQLVTIFLACALLLGCATVRVRHTQFDGVKRNLPYFCTTEKPAFPKKSAIKTSKLFETETENYDIFRLKFSDGYGEAEYFQSKIPGKNKFVIVLPVYGKHEIPAQWFSHYLTFYNPEADFNVIYFKEQSREDPLDLDQFVLNLKDTASFGEAIKSSLVKFRRILDRIEHALNWAENEESIDIKRIGIVGFSTSALAVSMAISTNSRLSAGAIILGGGNIHEMFGLAEETRVRQIREKILKNSRKNLEDLILSIRRVFGNNDPTCLAQFANPLKILFVDSHFDEFIPSSGRENYWRALGEPERITFFAGHKTSFLSLTPIWNYFLNKKIMEFLRKRL